MINPRDYAMWLAQAQVGQHMYNTRWRAMYQQRPYHTPAGTATRIEADPNATPEENFPGMTNIGGNGGETQ